MIIQATFPLSVDAQTSSYGPGSFCKYGPCCSMRLTEYLTLLKSVVWVVVSCPTKFLFFFCFQVYAPTNRDLICQIRYILYWKREHIA